MELTCGSETLGEVPIKRGIFQEDALSPVLFVMALIPLRISNWRDDKSPTVHG